jgi:hypothetical protein
MIPLGEKHLRRILAEWVMHYNQGRPHLSLGPGTPEPAAAYLPLQGHDRHSLAQDCKVVARVVLGGLHHEYQWERIAGSRLLYVLSRVICKGDNQKLQPNYSSILGDLAAGGISNLYIPEISRNSFCTKSHHSGNRSFRVRLSYSPTDSILCLRHSQFPGHKPPS